MARRYALPLNGLVTGQDLIDLTTKIRAVGGSMNEPLTIQERDGVTTIIAAGDRPLTVTELRPQTAPARRRGPAGGRRASKVS